MVLIEVTEFWMWIILSVIVGVAITFLAFILVSPKQVRTFIKARLLKRPIVEIFSDANWTDFKIAKVGPEGQVEINSKDIKAVLRGSNPLLRVPHLKGYGIPHFLAYDGSTVATTPATVMAMKIANTPAKDRETLPPNIRKWAKKINIPVKPQEEGDVENVSLFEVTRNQFQDFVDRHLSRSQLEVALDKREVLGEKKAGKQYMKAALPIMGILSILIIGILLLMPLLK